ncbi:hypothetical protein GCM10009759_03160 [Kitasatospora saccharophila]|uniref:Uncharacterized protein n=1 Tax=Kitasatospora saccharophila TaxID=407973 RepID=A0ABN2W5G9_9ACTN
MEEPLDNSAPRTLWTGRTHPFLWKTGMRIRTVRFAAQTFGAAEGPPSGPPGGFLPRRGCFHTRGARPAGPDRRDPATAGRRPGPPGVRATARGPPPTTGRPPRSPEGPSVHSDECFRRWARHSSGLCSGPVPGMRKGSRATSARLPYDASTAVPPKVFGSSAHCPRSRSRRGPTFVS